MKGLAKHSFIFTLTVVFFTVVFLSGCTIAFKKSSKQVPVPQKIEGVEEIEALKGEVNKLSSELEMLNKIKALEAKEVARTRDMLESKLKGEKGVKVAVEDRGVVITFLAEVLFDSGKAEIREEAYHALDKVSAVLNKELKDRKVAIEGHTDNDPIKHSGWKSNWELSTARATSVLHYIVDEGGVVPTRVQATGYGEFRPVASNDTKEGKQLNRRVEVVILPTDINRINFGEESSSSKASKSKK